MRADDELFEKISSKEFFRNPYPYFAKYRNEEPVFYSETLGGWIVLRYRDVEAVLRNHDIFSSKGRVLYLLKKLDPEVQERLPLLNSHFAKGLAHSDAPEHRRLRTLLSQAFTPRFIESFRPEIKKIVDKVIGNLGDEFDLINDLFVPVPALVVGKLLGSDESDIAKLIKWAGAINGLYEKGGNISAENALYAESMLEEIRSFVMELVEARRVLRTKGYLDPNRDVLAGLTAAEMESDKLSEQELVSTVVTLFVAGHETTTHLLGNGFYALFNAPNQLEIYRKEHQFLDSIVDEMARFDGSVPRSWRINKIDTEISGVRIPANSLILPMLASANRDPEVFTKPEQFLINRDHKKHLAFGKGVHVCLGAPLARIEGQVILSALLKYKPNLQNSEMLDSLEWREDVALRGLISLRVRD